jgi:hypothetical protein
MFLVDAWATGCSVQVVAEKLKLRMVRREKGRIPGGSEEFIVLWLAYGDSSAFVYLLTILHTVAISKLR